MSNDPYEILGIDRDATPDEINAAYKAHAKKAHPDSGGTPEDFTRVKQASMVLLDPKRRKRFDESGTFDDDGPDNTSSTAMQRVASFFVNSINATLEHPINLDQLDLVRGATQFFDQQIHGCQIHISGVEKQIKQFEKTMKRLKTKRKNDVIRSMLTNHVASLRDNINANRDEIKMLLEAKNILKDYEFEQMPQQPQHQHPNYGIFFPRGLR